MARIPIPQVAQEAGESGFFAAPEIAPQQDLTGRGFAVLGEGMRRAGFEASRVADFLQDQVDDARTTEADNRSADIFRKHLYDPQSGYFHKRGAAGNAQAREEAFEKIREELAQIEEGLDNDVQRMQWQKMANDRWQKESLRADQHQADSVFEHMWGATTAGVESARADGDLGLMKRRVTELSKMAGDEKEQARMRMLGYTTKFHEQAFNLMVEQEPQRAQTYLQQNKAEIDPKVQDNMLQRLATADVKARGEALFLAALKQVEAIDGTDVEKEKFADEIMLATRYGRTYGGKQPTDVIDNAQARFARYFNQKNELRRSEQLQLQGEVGNALAAMDAPSVDALPEQQRRRLTDLGMLEWATHTESRISAEKATKKTPAQVEFGIDVDTLQAANYYLANLENEVKMEKAKWKGGLPPDGASQLYVAQREAKMAEMSAIVQELELKPRQAVELVWSPDVLRRNAAERKRKTEEVLKALRASYGTGGGR